MPACTSCAYCAPAVLRPSPEYGERSPAAEETRLYCEEPSVQMLVLFASPRADIDPEKASRGCARHSDVLLAEPHFAAGHAFEAYHAAKGHARPLAGLPLSVVGESQAAGPAARPAPRPVACATTHGEEHRRERRALAERLAGPQGQLFAYESAKLA